MSATGAQEAQLGRLDVLQFGGDRAVAGLDARRQGQIQELRGLRLKTGGREAWRAVLDMKENETPYRHESTQQFESRFGAGEAEYDAANRRVSKEPTSPEKKAVYDEAKRLIEDTTKVMSYLELYNAKDPAATLATLQAPPAARPELNGLTLPQLRSQALDAIAADPAFQKLFPELGAKGVTAPQRRNMIEDTLAADPRFRARLEARMEGIYEQAQKLPELKTNPQLEADRQKYQGEYGTKVKQIVAELQKAGINAIPPAMTPVSEGSIRTLIDMNASSSNPAEVFFRIVTGVDVPATLASVAGNPAAQAAFGSGDFSAVRTAMQGITTEQIQALQNFRINLNTMPTPGYTPDLTYMQDFVTKHAGNVAALDANDLARQILDDWNVSGGVNNFADQQQIAKAKAMARAMMPPAGNQVVSLRDAVTDASSSRVSIQGVEARIMSDKDRLQSERVRLIEETKLLSQLETAMSNAMVDVMEDRYDQMIPLEEERLAAALKTAEEAKKTELAASIKKLGEKMGSKWLGYDKINRKRAPHKDAIKKDMQRLMYATNQEEEIKRMMIEDASLAKLKDSQGADVDWKNIDLTTGMFDTGRKDAAGKPIFEKADLTVLNDLYTSQKDAYTQKLFKSFFATRGWADRSFLGMASGDPNNLGLKDHEWVLLEQQFGDQVSEALMTDKQGRATIDKLKAEGVITGFKLKWLLYLLLIGGGSLIAGPMAGMALGGVAAVTLGGGAGTVIGGGIAGSVAAGVGGAGLAHAASERIH